MPTAPSVTIMLDPGHGGGDPGATGPTGLREKDVNLAVARLVPEFLPASATALLTRGSDVEVSLAARAAQANAARVDAFISIHCNSSSSRTAAGTETYVLQFGGPSERLATLIQQNIVTRGNRANRGVKSANFAVLRNTAMTSVLVELAFISNPREEALLRDVGFQRLLAGAIADAVRDFYGLAEAPAGSLIGKVVDDEAAVYLEGRVLANKAAIIAGTAYAPVRELAEALGYRVQWQPGRIDIEKP